jgi:hypothetical protein
MLMLYLYIQFHIPSEMRSLLFAIKPKAEYVFCAASCYCFTKKNFLQENMHIFEDISL